MKIRSELKRIREWITKEGRGRKALLVALSVLLSLNVMLSAMPRSALAFDGAVSNMNELLDAAMYGYDEIIIDSSFEINETVRINNSAILRPAFEDVTLTRAAGFKGALFEVYGRILSDDEFAPYVSLSIGDGITIDGNSTAVTAEAPLVELSGGELIVCGELVNNKNGAAGSEGGAVKVWRGRLIVDGGRIAGNSAYIGGGIYVEAGAVRITDGVIEKNTASYTGGGACIKDCVSVAISGVNANNAYQNSTVITGNKAPIGAGVYLSNVRTDGVTYTVKGGVYIDDNFIDSSSAAAMPGTECNLLVESRYAVPSFSGLTGKAAVGFYPMQNMQIPCELDYFKQGRLFYDNDVLDINGKEILINNTTYASGIANLNVTSTKNALGEYDGGTVLSDMGQEVNSVNNPSVTLGFPVHLIVNTEDKYTLKEGSFKVTTGSGDLLAQGSPSNGVWYTFNGGSETVKAEFVKDAVPVAKVNGVNYATLAEAFKACEGKPQAQVDLIKDLKIDSTSNLNYCLRECVAVPEGTVITLSAKGDGNEIRRDNNWTGSLFEVPARAKLILENIIVDGNKNVTGAEPVADVSGELVLNNSSIKDANGIDGGAVYLDNGALTFKNKGVIEYNTAVNGAGVYMTGSEAVITGNICEDYSSANYGNPDRTNWEFRYNTFSGCGGAVYMENGTVKDCEIVANSPAAGAADTMGGGIYVESGKVINTVVGAVEGEGTSFSNSAHTGGGIYAERLAMKNVSVTNNSATDMAGGVFCEDELVVAGRIVVDKNQVSSAASNLYLDVEQLTPIRVNGQLDSSSVIKLNLSETGNSVNGTVVAHSDSVPLNASNAQKFVIENAPQRVIRANDRNVIIDSAADCVSVTIKAKDNSGTVTASPEFDSVVSIPLDGGRALLEISNPDRLDVKVSPSDANAISVQETSDYNGGYGVSYYYIDVLKGASSGGKYTVEVSASYDYLRRSLMEYVNIDEAGKLMMATNEYAGSNYPSAEIIYSTEKVNPYASLNAKYYVWGSAESDDSVKNQLNSVKEDRVNDSYAGYFRAEPVITIPSVDNAPALGPIDESPIVTITLDVTDFAENGDYIDVASYNAMMNGNTPAGARLHKDLLVRNGYVSFDVARGTGANPDVVYAAVVRHNDYAASIGTDKYHTLADAFAAATTGAEIKVLRDVITRSALVVPSGKAITVSAENGARITRSEFYNGAIFFVSSGGELTLKNIVVDGGAEIGSGSSLTNTGNDAYAAIVANHGKLSVSGSSGFENGFIADDYGNSSADRSGGALYNGVSGNATIKDAYFDGNYAYFGGAINNSGDLKLEGCEITGNYAGSEGGAIYSTGNLGLTNTSVAYNKCSSKEAGGIYSAGKLLIAGDVNAASNTNGLGALSNVHNYSDSPIIIADALSDSSRIGISKPDKSGDVIAKGDGTKITDATTYKNRFFPDAGSLAVTADTTNKTVVFGSTNATYVTVSLSSGSNGTISPVGDVKVASGESLKITVTPTGSYAVADITVDGTSVLSSATVDATSGVATYTLSNITANKKVDASFKRTPGSVLTSTASANGTISPSGKVNVNSEDTVKYTITPSEGYYLDSLKLTGKDVLDDAVRNKDGSYTYVASGITDADATLNADFKPIYAPRTLVDTASGVEVTGSLHYKAKLSVENLAKASESLYNQMKEALDTTSADFTQYIAQAYEIKLIFDNEQDMEGWSKIKPNTEAMLTFNLGDSYEGKTVRIFHHNGSTIEKDAAIEVIKDDGKISVSVKSLSPFAVVVQDKKVTSGGSGGNTNNNNNNNGNSNNNVDGKGPVSGDFYEPKTVPPVVIVLLVLSTATVAFIVGKIYLPKFRAYFRNRYSSR